MVTQSILNILPLLLTISLVWLLILSVYTYRAVAHYKQLIRNTNKRNLQEILELILVNQEQNAKNLGQIAKEMDIFRQTQKQFLSKYSLIRFNPFEDVGGDQSFAFALLNAINNGIVVSSLHSRGGTKIYAKPVAGAKPESYGFSKEEKEVVEKAARYASDSVY
ncbi:DUF4446 family protein [Candidatus Curtissbacteria bacterium]|nr:DUF4446 family protein [Candidatus Curtissbacteria bacterium]